MLLMSLSELTALLPNSLSRCKIRKYSQNLLQFVFFITMKWILLKSFPKTSYSIKSCGSVIISIVVGRLTGREHFSKHPHKYHQTLIHAGMMLATYPSVTFFVRKEQLRVYQQQAGSIRRTTRPHRAIRYAAQPLPACLPPAIACIPTLLSIYSTLPHPTFYHDNNRIRFACEHIEKQCQPTSIRRNQQANVQNSFSQLRHFAEHETAASQFNQPPHHQPTARRFSEKQNTVLCLLCVCKLRSELNVVVVVCWAGERAARTTLWSTRRPSHHLGFLRNPKWWTQHRSYRKKCGRSSHHGKSNVLKQQQLLLRFGISRCFCIYWKMKWKNNVCAYDENRNEGAKSNS